MMRLDERYITLIDDEEKKQEYYDEVVDILNNSYASIGGAQSNALRNLMDNDILWKLVTRDGRVVAVLISKLIGGTRKAVLAGSDGSDRGKQDLKAIISEEVRRLERKSWGEVSDAMEHIYLKRGATMIPDDLASEIMDILGKKITPTGDGYHYIRKLGPNKGEHTKVIVGNEEQLRSFVDAMNASRVSEGVNMKQIELAKKLLESKGYTISRVDEGTVGTSWMGRPTTNFTPDSGKSFSKELEKDGHRVEIKKRDTSDKWYTIYIDGMNYGSSDMGIGFIERSLDKLIANMNPGKIELKLHGMDFVKRKKTPDGENLYYED